MKTPAFALLLIALTFVSCMEDPQLSALDKGPAPVGIWSNISYQDNSVILEKGPKLQDNNLWLPLSQQWKADPSGE